MTAVLFQQGRESWKMLAPYQQQQIVSGSVALTLLFLMYMYRRRCASRMKRLGMPIMYDPPQGRSIPMLGQALNFLRYRPWDLVADWHAQYGPIVCFPLLGSNMYSVASPQLLKAVLQSKISQVKKDVQNVMKTFMVILGTGIVTSEDDAWMKQRLKMSQPLRNDVLEMIPRQTLEAVQRLITEWDDAARRGASVAVGSSLRHLTLQVISGTFLSLSAEESDSTFAKMYLPIVEESNARVWHPYRSYLFVLPAFWLQIYNVYRLNAYVSQLIRDRWKVRLAERSASSPASRSPDILDRVLDAYDKECGFGQTLPDDQVRQLCDEMKTFMLAGHETSAAMMTWAIYELLGHTDLMKEMEAEGIKVFGKQMPDALTARPTDLPSIQQLSELRLSEATLKESLRKYCVVPMVGRRTIQDLHLTDEQGRKYLIPKRSSVLVNIQAVHHNPVWWPQPLKFDPYRFLRDVPIEPYTFVPFIAGPRNCLGQYLALLESKMVISLLVRRYRFALPKGAPRPVTETTSDWESYGHDDPRHRYMVPIIPAEELHVLVSLKQT